MRVQGNADATDFDRAEPAEDADAHSAGIGRGVAARTSRSAGARRVTVGRDASFARGIPQAALQGLTFSLPLLLAAVVLLAWAGEAHARTIAWDTKPMTTARCATLAPDSARGYAALWDTIPASQWGAADLSISVPLADGRVVWLYGDTMSAGRFVHSTAITQDAGCVHVSHAGAQLLPDDDAQHIYWIQSAAATEDGLAITARSVVLTGSGVWGFRDGGFSRIATVRVDASGDVTFATWGPKITSKAPNPGSLYPLPGKCHFGYSKQTHPQAALASGKTLVTMAQNWDCGQHPLSAYRPLWSEG